MQDRVPLADLINKEPQEDKITVLDDGKQMSPLDFMDDLNYHRMSDFFDLSYDDRKDPKIAEKLSHLTDWAEEQSKSKDRIQQMGVLNNLKRMLGITYKGVELIRHLYKWTRLDQRRRSIEQEMSFLTERNGIN